MSAKPIFAVESLTKSYQNKKPVLNDVNLVFLQGAKIGVIGQNGAGKSTLLRIMSGQDTEFDGVARLADGKTVGYVPQEPTLLEDLTVRENVEKAVEPIRDLLKAHEDVSMRLGEDLSEKDMAKVVAEFERLQAEIEAKSDVRQDLLRQLEGRLTTDLPEALIVQEIERRVEQLARHMMNQNIDPREANIDWNAFREQQRVAATDAVRSTLMLDAIVSREEINLTDEDITQEIERQAEASGRAPSAVRAFIEKRDPKFTGT